VHASASASQVMFTNRKERAELLEGLVVSNKDATVPVLSQVWPPLPFYYY
jgi:hypothetical protein